MKVDSTPITNAYLGDLLGLNKGDTLHEKGATILSNAHELPLETRTDRADAVNALLRSALAVGKVVIMRISPEMRTREVVTEIIDDKFHLFDDEFYAPYIVGPEGELHNPYTGRVLDVKLDGSPREPGNHAPNLGNFFQRVPVYQGGAPGLVQQN